MLDHLQLILRLHARACRLIAGYDGKSGLAIISAGYDENAGLHTHQDFGCVLHEEMS